MLHIMVCSKEGERAEIQMYDNLFSCSPRIWHVVFAGFSGCFSVWPWPWPTEFTLLTLYVAKPSNMHACVYLNNIVAIVHHQMLAWSCICYLICTNGDIKVIIPLLNIIPPPQQGCVFLCNERVCNWCEKSGGLNFEQYLCTVWTWWQWDW